MSPVFVRVFVKHRAGAGSARWVQEATCALGSKGEATIPGASTHAAMLRHACGFALANRGMDARSLQAYLGHHTVRYTEMSPTLFKGIWR